MATVRKYRGVWCADFYDQHRRRRIEKPKGDFPNKALEKRAAQELLAQRLAEIATGDYQSGRSRLTFSQVCDRYLDYKANLSPATWRGYVSLVDLYLRPYFGAMKVAAVRSNDVERFRAELLAGTPPSVAAAFAARVSASRPGLAQARARQRAKRTGPGVRTINKCLTLLVMIFNYAERHRWVDHNPAEHVEKLRVPHDDAAAPLDSNVLSPDEVARLLAAAEGPRRDRTGRLISTNYRLLIKVALRSGLRAGELLGLRWADLDWHGKFLQVRRAWREGAFVAPKTATSARRIDLTEALISELREWRLACPIGSDDLIFPNLDGKPLCHSNLLQRGFYPALQRAGLRQIRFHDLRHTFASLLLANGEDIVRVSRLLGHASPKITLDVYSHALPTAHYGTAERLERLLNGNILETETPIAAATGATR